MRGLALSKQNLSMEISRCPGNSNNTLIFLSGIVIIEWGKGIGKERGRRGERRVERRG